MKTRQVEYYRLWGGDHGTWDTDFVQIPEDTPEEKLEAAVREAISRIDWTDEAPVATGIYSAPQPDEENGGDDEEDEGPGWVFVDEDTGREVGFASAETYDTADHARHGFSRGYGNDFGVWFRNARGVLGACADESRPEDFAVAPCCTLEGCENHGLPSPGCDLPASPCIFCGTIIKHFNDGSPGWSVSAVVDDKPQRYLYCDQPPCAAAKNIAPEDWPIWRCGCVPDYVENVGDRCASCGRSRRDRLPAPEL
jgi:hypothetical protein